MEYNVENEEGILIQGRGNYCSKLKKGKLKTEKLLKISILDEQQTEPKQYKSKLRKYVFAKTWTVAITSIYTWK